MEESPPAKLTTRPERTGRKTRLPLPNLQTRPRANRAITPPLPPKLPNITICLSVSSFASVSDCAPAFYVCARKLLVPGEKPGTKGAYAFRRDNRKHGVPGYHRYGTAVLMFADAYYIARIPCLRLPLRRRRQVRRLRHSSR